MIECRLMRGLAAGGAVCAASALMAYAVRGRSSTLLAPSVYHGCRRRRSIALTFDDGPSDGTLEMLKLLEQYQARATFFVCGINVERRPDILREVSAAGHEIGNHTYSHPAFYFRSPRFIAGELDRAQRVIHETAGRLPALFRAPFGVRWFGLRQAQRRLNLLGVMWTVIGRDWTLTADRVTRRVLSGASNGAIVCLHDGRGLDPRPDIRNTLDALRRILPDLRARGFSFETVSQILCPTH